MSFNKYFQDELTYLRELGKEFSDANPQLAPFLAERGADPDVERLLEGFAFMTGRLSQKLNDQIPELTHGMIDLMWPHYLRPIPAMSVVEFTPVPNAIAELRQIPRGTELDSVPVEGTNCRFRTCYNVDVAPISLTDATLTQTAKGSRLVLAFRILTGGSLAQLNLPRLRLFINGDPFVAQSMYLWVRRYLSRLSVVSGDKNGDGQHVELPQGSVQPVGYSVDESLFDYSDNVFPGYRLLQDYFVLQDKFLFVDIQNLQAVGTTSAEFSLEFEFERPVEDHVRVNKDMFRLHATPVSNLFKRDGDPLRVDRTSMEYRVRPAGRDANHYEVYSIDHMESRMQGLASRKVYTPVASFAHEENSDSNAGFYSKHLKSAVTGRGFDTYVSFAGQKQMADKLSQEIISVDLTCTNRQLPEKLKVGDIKLPTSSSPEYVTFANITPVTPAVYPSLEADLQWQLISNMSLNYSTLSHPEMLKTVLRSYDFRALTDRQAERQLELKLAGIGDIHVEPGDRLADGLPVRGISITMRLKESHFTSEGDMFLFACVLNQFFSLYASINSYHMLTVIGEEKGEIYQWPLKMGLQNIL